MAQRSKFKTSVGGQAVLEGVMMRGPERWCLAVRSPSGEIVTETHPLRKRPWARWPLVRGVFNFVDSIVMGYSTLMRSAQLSMPEDEPEQAEQSKLDQWVERRFGDGGLKILMGISTVLGLLLALGLFLFLPTALVSLADSLLPLGWFKNLLEGVLKLVLFIGYLAAVSRMKEIRRVFAYHGAEHKTIACYEAGAPLTPEQVRAHSRFHPRCGTSFMLIVIVLSILLNSLLPWPTGWGGPLLRMGLKLLMLPVVMGVSYELIRLAGRVDNLFTRAISAPGLWLQRLTTCEPDDSMLEVAIAAVQPVLPETPEEAAW